MKSKNITLILLSVTLAAHANHGKNSQQKKDSTHSLGSHSTIAPHANQITNKNKQKSSVRRGGFGSSSAHGAGG